MKVIPVFFSTWRHSALAVAMLLSAPLAQAGLFDDDEARKAILELRQRIEASKLVTDQSIQRQAAVSEELNKRLTDEAKRTNDEIAVTKRSILELSNQLELLRAEQAKQRGQLEQLTKDLTEVGRRQREQIQTLDDRLKKLEPTKVSVDGREFFVDASERREFELALATFRRGEFPAAQAGFVELLRKYPNSGYASSSLFWIGNAQYATKDFKEAVTNFRDMIKRTPDHPRVPEAMLSLANSLIELKDVKSARAVLTDLLSQYPQSEAAAAGRERLTKLK